MEESKVIIQDLVREFQPNEDIRHALFLTYTFDGPYIEDSERGLFELLWQRNCQNMIVIRDGSAVINEKQSHRYRVLNASYSTRVFHSKLMFFLTQSGVMALVGSANLTRGGLEKNLELISIYRLDHETGPVDFFISLKEYFSAHLRKELNPVSDLLKALDTFLRDYELFLSEIPKTKKSYTEPIFLHNYDRSLLEKITDQLPSNNLMGLWVISPFYEQDKSNGMRTEDPVDENIDNTLIDEIFNKFKFIKSDIDKPLHLYFQPVGENKTNLPLNILGKYRSRISLFPKNTAVDSPFQRSLHAKMMLFIGASKSEKDDFIAIFQGSANFTKAALLSKPPDGNAEIGVLTIFPRKRLDVDLLSYYLYLNNIFKYEENWEKWIPTNKITNYTVSPVIQLSGGLLVLKDNKLIIYFKAKDKVSRIKFKLVALNEDLINLNELKKPFDISAVFDVHPEKIFDRENDVRRLRYNRIRGEAFDENGVIIGEADGPLNVDNPSVFMNDIIFETDITGLDNEIYLTGIGSFYSYSEIKNLINKLLTSKKGDRDNLLLPKHQADLDIFFRRIHIGFKGCGNKLERYKYSQYIFADLLRDYQKWSIQAIEKDDITSEQKLYLIDRIIRAVQENTDNILVRTKNRIQISRIIEEEFLNQSQKPIEEYLKNVGKSPMLKQYSYKTLKRLRSIEETVNNIKL